MMKRKPALFDLHCDTLTRSLYRPAAAGAGLLDDPAAQLSLSRMPAGTKWVQCFAVFVPDDRRGAEGAAFFDRWAAAFAREMEREKDRVRWCRSAGDLAAALDGGRFAALLTVEGGSALGGRPERVETLWDAGVRMMALTWNGQNELASGHNTAAGFSAFGREAVAFIDTIYMSFSKSLPFGEFEFEGIENYVEMFQSPEFWKATWNSVYFCILTVPVGVFLALLVAVLLNAKLRGRTAFRAIFFLPMVVAPAAVAMVWKWLFNTEYGIINSLLGQNIRWLTNPNIVLAACAIVAIWSSIGYDAVLLLSGIQNISPSLYEAAGLDGASKVTQFFHITLPMVSPTLFVVLIMRLCVRYLFYCGM